MSKQVIKAEALGSLRRVVFALSLFVSWMINLYVIMASVAILVFPVVGIAAYVLGKDKKSSVRIAMDVTMFFLIGAVSAMYDMLIGTDFKGFWIILLFLLLLTGLLGNAQNRKYGKNDLVKLIRAVWRLGFIALASCYLVMLVIFLFKIILSI